MYNYIYIFDFISELLNSSYSAYLIVFYNKYKVIEFYYYIYVNLYIIYKILKNFFVLGYFNMLKLYIIFINDTAFFKINNYIIIALLNLKKYIKKKWIYIRKAFLKSNKKFKNYYKFEMIGKWKWFLFLILFTLFVLIWKNRTAYRKSDLLVYLFIFYGFVIYTCCLIAPLFYFKSIGIIFTITFIFLLFLLKILNEY